MLCWLLTPQNSFVIKMFIKQKEMDEKLIVYIYLSKKQSENIPKMSPNYFMIWMHVECSEWDRNEANKIQMYNQIKSQMQADQVIFSVQTDRAVVRRIRWWKQRDNSWHSGTSNSSHETETSRFQWSKTNFHYFFFILVFDFALHHFPLCLFVQLASSIALKLHQNTSREQCINGTNK